MDECNVREARAVFVPKTRAVFVPRMSRCVNPCVVSASASAGERRSTRPGFTDEDDTAIARDMAARRAAGLSGPAPELWRWKAVCGTR